VIPVTPKIGIATRFSLHKVCLFAFIMVIGFDFPDAPLSVPTAAAASGYGIQGQMAPELNLSNWIDADPALALIKKLLRRQDSRLQPFEKPQSSVALLPK
jgi:hypothetical protein